MIKRIVCLALILLCCVCSAETDYEITENKLNTVEPLGVQETPAADMSWFDDALFLGDSVSKKLESYVTVKRREEPDFMGKAIFFTSVSLGLRTILLPITDATIHPTYNGEKLRIEQAVAATGCKKLYIMLGMNDAAFGNEDAVKNLLTLIDDARSANPELMVVIQSCTPRVSGDNPTNAQLFGLDLAIYEAVKDMDNVYFVDVAWAMRDGNGCLVRDYCVDLGGMALHLSDKGCEVWINWLLTHIPAFEGENND